MKPYWAILSWFGIFTLVGFGHASLKFPITMFFEPEAIQAQTAYRYAIERYNNSTNYTFKFTDYAEKLNTSDTYGTFKLFCDELGRGRFFLLGIANSSVLGSIKDYTTKFHMPYLTPSISSREIANSSNYVLQMRPLYHTPMLKVMEHYKWTKIYYVYDTEEGLSRLQQLYRNVNSKSLKVEVVVVRILDINNCFDILRNLDSRERDTNKYIILDISTETALQSLLRQITLVGMNRGNYHYLLGTLVMDELNLDDFKHGGVNMTGFRLVDPSYWKVKQMQHAWYRLNPMNFKEAGRGRKIQLEAALTLDAIDVIVHGVDSILKNDSDIFKKNFRRARMFNYDDEGIVCSKGIAWQHGQRLIDAFKKVKFDGMSGPIEFDSQGFRTNFKLDVMQLSLNSEPTKIGQWNKDHLSLTRLPPADNGLRKTGGKNKTIIITTIMTPPYILLKKQPEDGKPLVGNDRYEGYCVDLARELGKIVGVDYTLKLVEDGEYGETDTEGNWSGMVGELLTRKADMAVAPLTINSERERVIDFSKPFMSLGISIMIKKPEKQKPGVFSFMDPLSYEIWLCIIVAYIAVSIVLFLVSRFSPYEWQIEDSVNGPTFTNDFTILNSLWFSLGAFMQQGCDISPRSMSGRIVGSVWWFFTLIIISSYTANLAAFLTVERMLTPIESADDLAKQTEIKYGTVNAGSTKAFFRQSKVEVYQTMWDFMQKDQSVFAGEVEEGVDKVRAEKGKYAFLLESTMNDYYNQKKPCNTMKVGDNLDSKGYGVATPLKSPLREDISLAVLQLRESGELQKLKKKWWYDKGECTVDPEGKGSGSSALTLSNVAGIFYILIGGLGLSMVISLLEFLYKSRIEAMRQKKAFSASARSKTRMSIRGTPERENGGYTYTAPTQIVSFDAYSDGNTHTQV